MPKTDVGAGCAVIVFNRDREFSLLRRASHLSHLPSCYCLPGGWIEKFETMYDAGRREVLEEIGCELSAITAVGVVDNIQPQENHHTITALMAGILKEGSVPRNMEPAKCDEIVILPFSKINDMPRPLFVDYASHMSLFEIEKFLDEHLRYRKVA